MQIDSELLSLVKESAALAANIGEALFEKVPVNDSDYDFFVYQFLRRTISYGKSIILLTEAQFFHEVIVVARTVIEGMFYSESYVMDDPSLASKWRSYAIYEDHQEYDLYREYVDYLGAERVALAKKEFPFNKKSKWHKHGNIRSLIEKNEESLKLYQTLYFSFSQVIHWTPTEVIGEKLGVDTALVTTFESLWKMSAYADYTYNLGFGADLNATSKHFDQYKREALSKLG